MNAIVASVLLLLHGPDGVEVRISPDQVTHLRSAKPGAAKNDKIFPEHVNCMVNLTDGKFVTVVETCEHVQKMLEQVR